MKTKILTIAAILSIALVATKTAEASVRNNSEVSTVLTNVSHISKIEVHGNVELYVSDGNTDRVKVYNQYYAENALVQSKNGVLRISSYKAEKLVVWVTATDLRNISIYDNASVKTFGCLSKIDLDVNLYNNATAQLKLDSYRTSLTVSDNAKATVSGTVNEYSLKYVQEENIVNDNFTAVSTTKIQTGKAVKTTELAGL